VLVEGLLVGAVYAMVALGFSLVWGVMNVINLAHGSFVMIGAFVTFWLFRLYGVDPFVTLPVSFVVGGVLGYVIQKFIINRIVRAPPFMTLILTYGISIILVNAALILWTADYRAVTPSYADTTFTIGPLLIPYMKMSVLTIVIVLTVIFSYILNHTRLGRSIRATRMDLEAARLMGVNVANIYALTFAIGAGLAALAGSLISMLYPITPVMGDHYIGIAFVACALGGLGGVRGALIGGVLIGIIEAFSVWIFGVEFQQAVAYIALVLVLILLPRGILGQEYY